MYFFLVALTVGFWIFSMVGTGDFMKGRWGVVVGKDALFFSGAYSFLFVYFSLFSPRKDYNSICLAKYLLPLPAHFFISFISLRSDGLIEHVDIAVGKEHKIFI